MPRPKLYQNGRHKMMLEKSLALFLESVAARTGIPMTELLDEAVIDWKEGKGIAYLHGTQEEDQGQGRPAPQN